MTDLPATHAGWRRMLEQVRRRTGYDQEAEDHMHSALLRMLGRDGNAAIHNPAAFLCRVATNIAIDGKRREKVRAETAESAFALEHLTDQQPLQDEVLEAKQRLLRVEKALDRLPRRTREIFLMHRIHEMKYREIADELGISISAVEKHIANAALLLLRLTREG